MTAVVEPEYDSVTGCQIMEGHSFGLPIAQASQPCLRTPMSFFQPVSSTLLENQGKGQLAVAYRKMVDVLPARGHPAGKGSQLEDIRAQSRLVHAVYTIHYHPLGLFAQRWGELGGLPKMLFPPQIAGPQDNLNTLLKKD